MTPVHRTIKLRKIGSSVGAILPKELLDELHLENGDEVLVVRTDQGIMLTPFDPDFEAAMGAFERGRKKFRNALRELAQ